MKTNETEQRVFYSDTDHGQVVYYSNYLKWFEIGRTELLRDSGFDYAQFEEKGLMAPVVEVHCNYKYPARYNDIVIIKTTIGKIGDSSVRFNYEILRKNDEKVLAEGYTINVFVDMKKMKSVSIPEDLRKVLEG